MDVETIVTILLSQSQRKKRLKQSRTGKMIPGVTDYN